MLLIERAFGIDRNRVLRLHASRECDADGCRLLIIHASVISANAVPSGSSG